MGSFKYFLICLKICACLNHLYSTCMELIFETNCLIGNSNGSLFGFLNKTLQLLIDVIIEIHSVLEFELI